MQKDIIFNNISGRNTLQFGTASIKIISKYLLKHLTLGKQKTEAVVEDLVGQSVTTHHQSNIHSTQRAVGSRGAMYDALILYDALVLCMYDAFRRFLPTTKPLDMPNIFALSASPLSPFTLVLLGLNF